jgi:hypothetical protein
LLQAVRDVLLPQGVRQAVESEVRWERTRDAQETGRETRMRGRRMRAPAAGRSLADFIAAGVWGR